MADDSDGIGQRLSFLDIRTGILREGPVLPQIDAVVTAGPRGDWLVLVTGDGDEEVLVAVVGCEPHYQLVVDRKGALDTLLDGALIAASANLVNLFDLRPGRAVKFALLASAPVLASPAAPLAGPVLGASAALLSDDLAERSMLGDAGANALGAALGVAAVVRAPRPLRVALLGGVAGLILASERTSFSGVIDRVPVLRRLDRWGRLDPDAHEPASPAPG